MANNLRVILSLALIFFALSSSAFGQSEEKGVGVAGTEIPAAQQKNERSGCYVYNKYIIFTTETADGVGEAIAVSLRPPSSNAETACNTKDAKPHYLIENDDSNFFFGLLGDYLFMDVGTGPEPRELRIYHLAKKKKIYTTSYSEPIKIGVAKGWTLEYYQPLEKNLPKSQCPQARKWEKEGLGYGFEQRVVLEFVTLTEQKIGKPRCSPRQ